MSELVNEELLSAYLDDEATAAERAHVEQCLRDSADWRQLFDELRALRASIAALPRYKLDEDLGRRVLAEAERRMLSPAQAGPLQANPNPINPAQPNASHASEVHANGEPRTLRVEDKPGDGKSAAEESAEGKSTEDMVALDRPRLRLPRGWRPWVWPAAAVAAALLMKIFGQESPPLKISHVTFSDSADAKSELTKSPDFEAPRASRETFIGAAPAADEPATMAKDARAAEAKDGKGKSDRMLKKAAPATAAAEEGADAVPAPAPITAAAPADADSSAPIAKRAKGGAGEVAEQTDAEPMDEAGRDMDEKLSQPQRRLADGEAKGRTVPSAAKKPSSRGAARLDDIARDKSAARAPAEKFAGEKLASDMPPGAAEAPMADLQESDALGDSKGGAQNAAEAGARPGRLAAKSPAATRRAFARSKADGAQPADDDGVSGGGLAGDSMTGDGATNETAIGLAREDVLMVKCQLQPQAIESGAFNELLARNFIATTPTTDANAVGEPPQLRESLRNRKEPAARQNEPAARQNEPAAQPADGAAPSMFWCEASPRQIAATLAEMQQRPDEFASVAVQPAAESSIQQELVQYNRAGSALHTSPSSVGGESNFAKQATENTRAGGGFGGGMGGGRGRAEGAPGADSVANGGATNGSAANGVLSGKAESAKGTAAPAAPAAQSFGGVANPAPGPSQPAGAGGGQAPPPNQTAASGKTAASGQTANQTAASSQTAAPNQAPNQVTNRPAAPKVAANKARSANQPPALAAPSLQLTDQIRQQAEPAQPSAAPAGADGSAAEGEQAGEEQKIRVVFLLWAAAPSKTGGPNEEAAPPPAAVPLSAEAAPAKESTPPKAPTQAPPR